MKETVEVATGCACATLRVLSASHRNVPRLVRSGCIWGHRTGCSGERIQYGISGIAKVGCSGVPRGASLVSRGVCIGVLMDRLSRRISGRGAPFGNYAINQPREVLRGSFPSAINGRRTPKGQGHPWGRG